jgi:hypothetical protein
MDLSYRVGQIDQRVTAIETTLDRWKHWSMRLVVMFALWMFAVLGHLNAEQMAKLLVSILRG